MRQKDAGMQAFHRDDSRKGSIFVLIFVFIALFAALSFAMLQGIRTGESSLNDQEAKLVAAEMLEYANKVKDAVKTLRINGCGDTEISFDTTYMGTDYVNPDTPPDNSCKVFHAAGGRIAFPSFSKDVRQILLHTAYTGRNDLDGIGTNNGNISSSDLAVTFTISSKSVCEAYNRTLNIASLSPPPPETYYTESDAFTGTYGPYRYVSAAILRGKPTACYDAVVGSDIKYVIYYTLLAR